MRLWHKDLISVLPRKQLISQWRECCAIAKSIAETGTPNHILVNRIMNYPLNHFNTYAMMIAMEMEMRKYHVDRERFRHWMIGKKALSKVDCDDLFAGWHNERYLTQCFTNLQEKYDCGGISEEEWYDIVRKAREYGIYL